MNRYDRHRSWCAREVGEEGRGSGKEDRGFGGECLAALWVSDLDELILENGSFSLSM